MALQEGEGGRGERGGRADELHALIGGVPIKEGKKDLAGKKSN